MARPSRPRWASGRAVATGRSYGCLGISVPAVVAIVAVALLLVGAPRPAEARKSPEAALVEWLVKKGGEINAVIDTRGRAAVRGTYATKAVKKDGLLAKIPLTACIWFPSEYGDFAELGAIVAREAVKKDSAWAPYLDALPMVRDPRHTISYETFPPEYVHLIVSELMSSHITGTQAGTLVFWAKEGISLMSDGVTLDGLRAALVTVATRYFGITHKGVSTSVMIPLLDFANHDENCTNYYEYLPCSYDDARAAEVRATGDKAAAADAVERDDLCVFWRAGGDVEKGQELCNRYGYLSPDAALFQYGFLLPSDPPDIARCDQAHFSSDHIYGALAHEEPTDFDGDEAALRAEAERVAKRIAVLESAEKAEATTPVAPGDKGGAVLAGLKGLRQHRLRALRRELSRLERRVAEKAAGGAAAGGDGSGDSGSKAADGDKTEL